MTTIAIRLPEDQAKRLASLAERLQVSVEELATAGVLDLLGAPDEQFNQIVKEVLEKNAELYRRLV
jgi:predicted transcriptional regulator